MTVKENSNFVSVEDYGWLDIKDIVKSVLTIHLRDEQRLQRIRYAVDYNKDEDGKQAEIEKVFLVDKGHEAGKELHCITKKGLIFILNERKFKGGLPCFITILFPRPNQLKRLYEAIGEEAPKNLVKLCHEFVDLDLHHS